MSPNILSEDGLDALTIQDAISFDMISKDRGSCIILILTHALEHNDLLLKEEISSFRGASFTSHQSLAGYQLPNPKPGFSGIILSLSRTTL